MGIKDLLRFMKPYTKSIHIKEYAGKRVGIDAYSWLHKGAYSCSMEICLDSDGDRKLRYLDYFMHRINLLRHHGITPVVVFDGGSIPCKSSTELERHRKRETNRELAMEKLKEGNVAAASELFQRAVSITPLMAQQLIQILRLEKVEFVVAPYEADAQLAYLSSLKEENGGIEAVITEDSDLLAYGCQAVIFKLDRFGNGEEIVLDKVFDAADCKPSFKYFNKELFTGMCILAGCDFLPSVSGIGIAKAHSFVSKYRNLDRVLSVLKLKKGNQMPEDYIKSFKETVAVFQHARIYDVSKKRLVHMKPVPKDLLESLDKFDFLGPDLPASIATAIAEGNLNPSTKKAFNYFMSSGYQPDPIKNQNSGNLQNSEADVILKKRKLVMGFCSPQTREGMLTNADSSALEVIYAREALQLQKLISVPKIRRTEDAMPHKDIPRKIPINPFSKMKTDFLSVQINGKAEEANSVVTEDEKPDANCVTPDNDRSKALANIPFKKRKHDDEVQIDQRDDTREEISGLTRLEDSNISIVGSQESVNSKPKGTLKGKRRGKNSKLGDNRSLVSKNCTILNFFSRV